MIGNDIPESYSMFANLFTSLAAATLGLEMLYVLATNKG